MGGRGGRHRASRRLLIALFFSDLPPSTQNIPTKRERVSAQFENEDALSGLSVMALLSDRFVSSLGVSDARRVSALGCFRGGLTSASSSAVLRLRCDA